MSELGEFIRFNSCARRFRLSMDNKAEARRLPFFERLFSPLDPILQQAGQGAEETWQDQLLDLGYREIAPAETAQLEDGEAGVARTPWADFAAIAAGLHEGERAFGREIEISGRIGDFDVKGAIDFVILDWSGGRPTLRLVEGKSSRKDRTYHRIQVVCYRMLLAQTIAEAPIHIAGHQVDPTQIQVAVVRIEEDTGQVQPIVDVPALEDTERESEDVERLLSSDGLLAQFATTELDALPFQLNSKCDGCVFNADCLPEAGRTRRLELLGLEPNECLTLRSVGIENLDALADIDLDGPIAEELRDRGGTGSSLARLSSKARARRSTLPRGDADPDDFPVSPLPFSGSGQLPEHSTASGPLTRVYLAVDYDYTENRVGALSAHITRSTHELLLAWDGEFPNRVPDPEVREQRRVAVAGPGGQTRFDFDDERPLDENSSKTVVRVMPTPWTGNTSVDTGAEKVMIQDFFMEIVDAIRDVAMGADESAIHFYAWSKNEVARLVEACARTDSRLLGHLRELLGSRESLEQLIYSEVGHEIDSRYGLGWTGRGLVVATSLTWFGSRFHWTRTYHGDRMDLDRLFTQDLFDFKTTLGLDPAGEWHAQTDGADSTHRFEIRARHFDSLPAPYWRAMWGTLPTASELNSHQVAGALDRYSRVGRPEVLAYLSTRVQALRWIEERVAFKNRDIVKSPIRIAELPRFDLGVHDIARASIDVLRLDNHIRSSGWLAEHLAPVSERVASGVTLPVRDVQVAGNNRLRAILDVDALGANVETARALWTEGAFIRLTIRGDDINGGQSLRQLRVGGLTAVIKRIDWTAEEVEFDVVRPPGSRYIFSSVGPEWAAAHMRFASVDDSPSDFVAGRVESRLIAAGNRPAIGWLDPLTPSVPDAEALDEQVVGRMQTALARIRVTRNPDRTLDPSQLESIVDGLSTRIHLMQGPPGTGKTATTAIATLARIALRHEVGAVVLVSATTHSAVDGLMQRISAIREEFQTQCEETQVLMPDVSLVRVDPHESGAAEADVEIGTTGCVRQLQRLALNSVLIIGGTTAKILRLADTLSNAFPEYDDLIVDEASMMVFPHYLALASLLSDEGYGLVVGDHRQLSPILAHDWESEDRPPVELYQPHLSAFEAIARLVADPATRSTAMARTGLTLSFRLPPRVVDLISRVYAQDQIALQGRDRDRGEVQAFETDPWEAIWGGDVGLFLIVHDEAESKRSNLLEIEIIDRICGADAAVPPEDLGIITPHRAQREMLSARLGDRASVIDTVERLQGGERPAIIVSGTASDPTSISSSARFILDLNRSNVAFSRVKDRLIVVAARTLLDHVPSDLDQYDQAILWKALRSTCSSLAAEMLIDGHVVKVFTPAPVPPIQIEVRPGAAA